MKLELMYDFFLMAMSDRGSKFTMSVDSNPDLDWQPDAERRFLISSCRSILLLPFTHG